METTDSLVIPGLKRIALRIFRDERGHFAETYNDDDHAFTRPDGTRVAFVEDDVSVSRGHVLRGLHGDDRTYKLIQCLHGAMYFVVADCRRDSPGYLRWEAHELSGDDPVQLLIPAGCAGGFVALSETAVLTYKQSERYRGEAGQFTVRWNDPALAIKWPVEQPLLSTRDASAPDLAT